MSGDMETLLELIQSLETSMTTVCTLAGKVGVPRYVMINLNATKLSLLECKDLLLNFSQVITNHIDSVKTENKQGTIIKNEPVIEINSLNSNNLKIKSTKLEFKMKLNPMENGNIIDHDQEVDNGNESDELTNESENDDVESSSRNNSSGNINKPCEEQFSNQQKAEILLEHLNSSVKLKNHKFSVVEIVEALDTNNFEYFITVEEKDGEVIERCGVCNSASSQTLLKHIEHHFITKSCNECNGMYYINFQSTRHREKYHYGRCSFCNRPIQNAKKHEEICPRRKVPSGLTCHHCGKICSELASLRAHVRDVHEQKPCTKNLVCETCGKTNFKNMVNYRWHVKKHIDPFFYCKICNAQFNTTGKLYRHKKDVHMDVIGEFCDICGIKVPSIKQHNWIKHKPVDCSHCGKQYQNKLCLRKHVKLVHQKDLLIACELCNKEFSCKSALIKHMRNVHKMAKWTTTQMDSKIFV